MNPLCVCKLSVPLRHHHPYHIPFHAMQDSLPADDKRPSKRVRLSSSDGRGDVFASAPTTTGDALSASPPIAPDSTERAGNSEGEKEFRAGITALVNPHTPGFSGILKQR